MTSSASRTTSAESAAWYDAARFGMFIHWSQISQAGLELSWPLVTGEFAAIPSARETPVAEYYSRVDAFDPTPGAAREWAALAREAGMKYGVLTTKHHDGYALFPSAHGDFGSARDLVREYVDAFRAEGLRVGFYYSLSDWHHPDYPAFTEDDRPYVRYLGKRSPADAWARYQEYLFGHVRELLTNYGEISVLWFDGQWERSMPEWRADELGSMIRELQPNILVNDRLPGQGDIETPEQFVPAQPPDGRWETCMTMNRSWGYVPDDEAYKSARDLIHTLCETASRGGNLLLNVSPRGDGTLPPEQVERLRAVASWMGAHHESIHDTSPGLESWQFYGPSTRRGDRVFVHLLMRPYESVTVRGLPIKHVKSVRKVATGEELSFTTRSSAQDTLTNADPTGDIVITVPESVLDPYATVLELQGDGLAPS